MNALIWNLDSGLQTAGGTFNVILGPSQARTSAASLGVNGRCKYILKTHSWKCLAMRTVDQDGVRIRDEVPRSSLGGRGEEVRR